MVRFYQEKRLVATGNREAQGCVKVLSTGTQMRKMEQIHADYYLDLRRSAGDLRQSAFYFSTLT